MKYVIFGLPGSGKGTYSQHIFDLTGAVQLSTGDLLRKMKENDNSYIGEEIRSLGPTDFARDEIIIEAIKKELKNEKYANGVIFDGFPRTLRQAEKMLELGIVPDAIIQVECQEETIKSRISGRRVHIKSGRGYHIEHNPPRNEGLDDITGEPLSIRADDKPELLDQRFKDYNEKTLPAFDFLKSKCKNGSGPIFVKLSGENINAHSIKDLKVTLGSVKSIISIRNNHQLVLISQSYSSRKDEKNKQDIISRTVAHNSLMQGEVPFSAEIFYFQKNMFDPTIEKHIDFINNIKLKISEKCNKIILIGNTIKDEKTPYGTKINDITLYFSANDILCADIIRKNNGKVDFISRDSVILDIHEYDDKTTNIKFDHFHEILDKKPEDFVIIESPYAGNIEEILKNETYARIAVLDCLNQNNIPFASHILYTQKGILEDTNSAQRRLGIEAGLLFGELCSKTVLYSDLGMTPGMIEGIEKAKVTGRNIEIKTVSEFQTLYENAIKKRNPKQQIKP